MDVYTLYDPPILLLGIYPKHMWLYVHQNQHARIFMITTCKSQELETFQCTLKIQYKLYNNHTMEYNTAREMSKLYLYTKLWMNSTHKKYR